MMKRFRGIITTIAIFTAAMSAFFGTVARADTFELPDGTVACTTADVRRTASSGSESFWKLKRGDQLKVKAINGDFYKVKLSGDKEGYVVNTCLDVVVWARVMNAGAWMHTSPSATADVVGDLRNITWVRITNRWRTWYEVTLNDRRTKGWVEDSSLQAPAEFFAAWLAFNHPSPVEPSAVASNNSGKYRSQYLEETSRGGVKYNDSYYGGGDYSNVSGLRYNIVSYAKGFLGTPYVYGGTSPSGFDCSGFVHYVFKNNGVTIARNSSALAEQGTYVAPSELQAGDLVFFGRGGGNINHVGIYIGGGSFIHASSSGKNGSYVRISPLFEGHYWTRYVTARRILP